MKKSYNQPRVETVGIELQTNILNAASRLVDNAGAGGMGGE